MKTVGDDYLFEYKNGKDTYYYIVVDGNFNATKLRTACLQFLPVR